MAGAGAVELDPGEPFAVAGARAVEVRTEEQFGHAAGVRDMRVALRRLRAVLEIFAPAFPRDGRPAPHRTAYAGPDAVEVELRARLEHAIIEGDR